MTDDLQVAAARSGGHCWVERRLFEVLGAWSAVADAPAAVVVADRLAQHAAWRSGQWWDRLPVLAGTDREALVVPGARWEWLAGPVAALGVDAPDAAAGLAVVVRLVLPRLAADYVRRSQVLAAHVDGAAVRTLEQCRSDLARDWADAAAVLDDVEARAGRGPVVGHPLPWAP